MGLEVREEIRVEEDKPGGQLEVEEGMVSEEDEMECGVEGGAVAPAAVRSVWRFGSRMGDRLYTAN